MNYLDDLKRFQPLCEQEEVDHALMLQEAGRMPVKILSRESALLHMTASAMVVNPARTHVLMAYHNIYGTWAWTGGHADGESDLLAVARREAQEETRIEHLTPIQTGAISLEILDVPSHVKRGRFVPCHLHLNMTYAFVGDDRDALQNKADENRAVRWLPIDKLADFVAEPAMLPIYRKILQRII